jgi:SAM-dependent methyltransferase
MKPLLGVPTSYNFNFPKIRYELTIKYIKKCRYLLDYGCGNGANTILFKDESKLIYGIDIEKKWIEEAIRELHKRKISNIKYEKYNGRHIPHKNNFFDVVTAFEVLEHTQNDQKALEEIYRVIKNKGILCISVPNKWYLMDTHGFNMPFKNIIPWNRIPFLNLMPDSFYLKYGNARIYTKSGICNLLEINHFRVINTYYIKPPLDRIKNKHLKQIINSIIQKLPEFMGVSLLLVARKE